MKLTRYKLGDLIEIVDERNSIGIRNFYGININKEFMPTISKTDGLDEKKYKLVKKNRFVYSGMQTGRDKCIRISLYSKDEPIIISPAYTTFEINDYKKIIPEYLFMFFKTDEKDRLGWFYSDSSIRSNLDWERFIDINIDLPPLDIQQKYVDVYNAMLSNQKSYEKGLEDLKLVCDAYIEDLRRNIPCEEIGEYIEEVNERNIDSYNSNILGVESSHSFCKTKANTIGLNLSNYKVVSQMDFTYNPSRINLGSIALLKDNKCIVSPMYIVFRVMNIKKIIPEFLMIWFSRDEFKRSTLFFATGSVRDTFDFNLMKQVKIPIPDIKVQQSIVDIYKVYKKRKEINEKLKTQIKDICKILIRGSIEEAKR